MAPWRSGDAAVCKTAYTGSIPVGASIFGRVLELVDSADLKSVEAIPREGSSPSSPTSEYHAYDAWSFSGVLAVKML